jgi:hypothetical protein
MVIVSLGFGISGLVVRLVLVKFLVQVLVGTFLAVLLLLVVGTLLLVLLHFEIFLLVV